MGLKPDNPVVGGTVLTRDAIRSPNYVAGQSGWTINQDGSAEFNNGVFRGILTAGSLFIYRGTPGLGTLSYSITENTVDPFGNPVEPGATSYTANGKINENGAITTLYDAAGNPAIILDATRSAIFVYKE